IASLPEPTATVHDAPGSNQKDGPYSRIINVLQYGLAVGGDNRYFTIDANGQLQPNIDLNAAPKYHYPIRIIRTATVCGFSTVRPYVVNVVPLLAHSIVVTPATLIASLRSRNGTIAGTVKATDVSGQKLTYAITKGNIGGAFTINRTTGEIIVVDRVA